MPAMSVENVPTRGSGVFTGRIDEIVTEFFANSDESIADVEAALLNGLAWSSGVTYTEKVSSDKKTYGVGATATYTHLNILSRVQKAHTGGDVRVTGATVNTRNGCGYISPGHADAE